MSNTGYTHVLIFGDPGSDVQWSVGRISPNKIFETLGGTAASFDKALVEIMRAFWEHPELKGEDTNQPPL